MTPEAQRVAIAEWCGWIWHGDASWPKSPNNYYWKSSDQNAISYQLLPDYASDLNAIVSATRHLDEFEHIEFSKQLFHLLDGEYEFESVPDNWFVVFDNLHATAAQRCEALLKTLGLWKD